MKHLVDIDEDALRAARARLGTQTIKETVNHALRRVGGADAARAKRSLDVLTASASLHVKTRGADAPRRRQRSHSSP